MLRVPSSTFVVRVFQQPSRSPANQEFGNAAIPFTSQMNAAFRLVYCMLLAALTLALSFYSATILTSYIFALSSAPLPF
jgi:hypothetical protein